MIHALSRMESACRDLDAELETERLVSLIDGLAMHAVIEPERLTSALIRSVVAHYLRSRFGPVKL